MQNRMLSKEDEASTSNEEITVRREDQEKINKFSRLHQREALLEEQLRRKQKDKEDFEEIVSELEELELMDEDGDKIPYKIGDSFFSLSLPEVQALVTGSTERIEQAVEKVESKLNTLREEMTELKVALYARFGRSINLET